MPKIINKFEQSPKDIENMMQKIAKDIEKVGDSYGVVEKIKEIRENFDLLAFRGDYKLKNEYAKISELVELIKKDQSSKWQSTMTKLFTGLADTVKKENARANLNIYLPRNDN